ncbi:hypothetical protein BJN34_35815 (plasmid) [Cupriavidus necator]|uniref:Extra-cytoplasmic solute receptor n=1 Tax=Cupriavidus necator TaxID=106590 RepID=A0A1U9V3N0_CUPNE|nr:tripartite tricarboxylate transporter substrate-binding protein [Cupriavidus necator]AQV99247.1 hypothetical protein BJN34_35815 [Cupriavidus necator]
MMSVPYKKIPQIRADCRGEVGRSFATASTAAPMIQAKKLKYLAIAASMRHPCYPNVPTMVESGGPNINLKTWVGIVAPAGTSKEAMSGVSTDVAKVMADPEIKAKWDAVGLDAGRAPHRIFRSPSSMTLRLTVRWRRR